jgi:hypothetical protein
VVRVRSSVLREFAFNLELARIGSLHFILVDSPSD